jgi:hypothetical protein
MLAVCSIPPPILSETNTEYVELASKLGQITWLTVSESLVEVVEDTVLLVGVVLPAVRVHWKLYGGVPPVTVTVAVADTVTQLPLNTSPKPPV